MVEPQRDPAVGAPGRVGIPVLGRIQRRQRAGGEVQAHDPLVRGGDDLGAVGRERLVGQQQSEVSLEHRRAGGRVVDGEPAVPRERDAAAVARPGDLQQRRDRRWRQVRDHVAVGRGHVESERLAVLDGATARADRERVRQPLGQRRQHPVGQAQCLQTVALDQQRGAVIAPAHELGLVVGQDHPRRARRRVEHAHFSPRGSGDDQEAQNEQSEAHAPNLGGDFPFGSGFSQSGTTSANSTSWPARLHASAKGTIGPMCPAPRVLARRIRMPSQTPRSAALFRYSVYRM